MSASRITDLYDDGKINHATWLNALRYLCGDYHDHRLCRNAWLQCAQLATGTAS